MPSEFVHTLGKTEKRKSDYCSLGIATSASEQLLSSTTIISSEITSGETFTVT